MVKVSRGATRHEADYGLGQHVISESQLPVEELELQRKLLARFRSAGYQPPVLPTVALDVMNLSRRPNVNLDELVTVLARDPMLAARTLQVAQSPVYASRVPARTLADAAARLGLRALRDIVMEVALNMKIFRVPAYAEPMERLRRHSTATAHLARMVAQEVRVDAEFAFICGLLHDVGIAGALFAVSDPTSGMTPPKDQSLLWPAVNTVHEEAGSEMARLWKLPPDIVSVLRHHHQLAIGGKVHPLAAIVCIAELMAEQLGAAFSPQRTGATLETIHVVDRVIVSSVAQACGALRIDRDALAKLHAKGEEVVKNALANA